MTRTTVKELATRVTIIEDKIEKHLLTTEDLRGLCAENSISISQLSNNIDKLSKDTEAVVSTLKTVKGVKAFLFTWVAPGVALFLLFKDFLK